MTDNEITDLIETLSCIYEDYLDLGVDPTSVASVMLAVAVKQLQKALDRDEFDAIMKDLAEQQFKSWDELDQEDEDFIKQEINKKRILH